MPHTKALVLAIILVVAGGCDNLVEKVDEERAVLGRYEATAPPDSLVIEFVPGAAYDELNEQPYLPDTAFNLLDRGGRFELLLREGEDAANKGTALMALTLPDTLFLDADSSFLLTPAAEIEYESDFISVIDRIVMNEEGDTTSATALLPMRWRLGTGGRLSAEEQTSVIRPVTRFDTQRGKYVTRNETLGTAYVRVTLRKR